VWLATKGAFVNLVQWKIEYETGVDRIDFQHRNLVNILNDLISVPDLEEMQRQKLVELNLEEMIRYTSFHFEVEEQFMTEAHYPKFAEHKKEHEALKAKAMGFVDRFNKGERNLEGPIIEFLWSWLINHIGKSDMDYVPYVLKHQAAS
jgi:hemerythrin